MPNKIFIQELTGTAKKTDFGIPKVFPLVDDITLTIETSYASYSSLVPGLDKIKTLAGTLSSVGGSISEGGLEFQNAFDLQRWERTMPVRINPKLIFYIKESGGLGDVYDPMMELIRFTVPTFDEETGKYILPGISLSAMGDAKIKKATGEAENISKGSKLIAIKIPGVIHLKVALLQKAIPTFSKHLDEDGWPIWGILDTEIISLAPANSKMLDYIKENKLFGNNVDNVDLQAVGKKEATRIVEDQVRGLNF